MAFLEKIVLVNTTDTVVFTCPVTQSGSIHGLVVSNTSNSDKTIHIKVFSQELGTITSITGTAYTIAANNLFTWPKPINIMAGDSLILSASESNSITAIASIYINAATPAQIGFTPRGTWSSTATYISNDVVSLNNTSYIAVSPSTNSSPPSANWMVMAGKGDTGIMFKGNWSNASFYNPNDVVASTITNHLYIANTSSNNKEPSLLDSWDLFLYNDSVSASATYATNAATAATTATNKAAEASTSATNAATEASTATTKAAEASTSATNAATATTTATTKAAEASISATNADTSAATATTKAAEASTSATNAATSAATSSASSTLAQNWATQLVTPVSAGEYSAKYWAQQAATSVTGQLVYRGSWSADTGVYPSTPALGDYYKVSIAGTVSSISYDINDSIIYNGSTWDKIDSSDTVASVAGKVGVVTLVKADIGLANVDNTSDVNKPVSTAQATADTATLNAATAASTPIAHIGTGGTSHASATTTVAGFMTGGDKTKLDGIAIGATAYTHPANHPASIIAQDTSNRFVTDAEKAFWNAKQPAGTYATGTGTASGSNTGDQIIPTTLPASDVSAWAKAATKPSYTAAEVGAQDVLVSGANIRTVNGNSLLGSTDLVIDSGVTSVNGATGAVTVQDVLVSGTNIRTVNGNSLLGSTDLVIAGGVSSVNGQTGALTGIVDLTTAQALTNKTLTAPVINNPTGTGFVTSVNSMAGAVTISVLPLFELGVI